MKIDISAPDTVDMGDGTKPVMITSAEQARELYGLNVGSMFNRADAKPVMVIPIEDDGEHEVDVRGVPLMTKVMLELKQIEQCRKAELTKVTSLWKRKS